MKGTIPRIAPLGIGAAGLALLPIMSEIRVRRAMRPPADQWQDMPVEPHHSTLLGLSFRPLQAEALGLDARTTLRTLLTYPFQIIRLGAYWNCMEPEAGRFCPDELDRQVDAAERAGKQIILCVGAVKTFGYPELFVPDHYLSLPLPEGALVKPAAQQSLLSGATAFVERLVERYRDRKAIVAWQVEHEAVDPLGMEHSWRLATAFVRAEVDAVRAADPTRPIMMNGFLPTSLPVSFLQWRRTRDQGDSLIVAQRLADMVGIDFYPRHALVSLGAWTVYLAGSGSPWQQRRRKRLFAWAQASGRPLMITEGQAEPWETANTPPNPSAQGMYSCMPEQVIANYNQCMRWAGRGTPHLYAYLFWGAEYWLLREQSGDARYIRAFTRVLERA